MDQYSMPRELRDAAMEEDSFAAGGYERGEGSAVPGRRARAEESRQASRNAWSLGGGQRQQSTGRGIALPRPTVRETGSRPAATGGFMSGAKGGGGVFGTRLLLLLAR